MKSRFIFAIGIFLLAFFSAATQAQVFDYRLVPADLAADFQKGVKLIEQNQVNEGFNQLDQALALVWKYQIQDLPAYSAELIRLCSRMKPSAEAQKKFLDYSFYFAPHSAEMALARTRFFFSADHFSLNSSLAELGKGIELLYYDLPARLRLQAMLWAAVAEFFELGLMLLSTLIIFSYCRVLLHWSGHRFPESFKNLNLPLLMLIALVPVYFGAGLWPILVWPGILCLPFARRSLRVIFLALLLLFCFTGLFRQKAQQLLVPLTTGPVLSQYHISMGLAGQTDLENLRKTAENSNAPGVLLALAEVEHRVGNDKRSEELLTLAIGSPSASALAYNQLGCLYLEKGQTDQAISALEKAVQGKEPYAEIYFNLSQAYSNASKYDQSDAAYKKASQLSEETASRLVLAKKLLGQTQVLMKMPIPASLIARDLPAKADFAAALLDGKYQFLLFIVALGLVISIGRGNKTKVCYYCGRLICPSCLPESRSQDICNPCYQVFVSGKTVDPKLRIEQKTRVRNYHRLMGGIGIVLSVPLPGSGLIIEEKIISGVFLIIWPVLFLALVLAGSQVPAPLVPVSGQVPAWIIIGLMVYAVMSLVSILLYLILPRVEV